MKVLAAAAGLVLTVSSFTGMAFAASPHMETLGITSQPIGHYVYCKQYSRDCRLRTANPSRPKLTRERWDQLVRINTYSNNTIAPFTDFQIYKEEEVWAYPERYGDCEDYVLMKRKMLMEQGWPPSSLLITVVRQPNGEGHAVLTVRTSRADYILDNLSNEIRPWHKTPYRFLKRQSERHSGRWIDIRDPRPGA